MDIKKEIEKYIPSCEQEIVDKELILEYLDKYKDIFTRDNKLVHMTTSALIVNKKRNKVLMEFHNIYKSWGWVGGHADGDKDLLRVIKKEIEEETGVKNIYPIVKGIFSLGMIPVLNHFRKGEFVSTHVHASIDYLFEADENEKIRPEVGGNSDVAWKLINEMVSLSTEPHMKIVYQKLIDKLQNISK